MSRWNVQPLWLLAAVAMSLAVHSVAGQAAFVPVSDTRSSTRASNVTTLDSAVDSLEGSASSSESGSGSGGDDSSGSDGSDTGSQGNDSWVSGSDGMEYKCSCKDVRKVSLMGASDYCLLPEADLSSKCGNVLLAEDGECPRTGAQPCSAMGHVLANDSMCALDDKDDTYKCVASKDDLLIQKNGGKKKNSGNKKNGGNKSASNPSDDPDAPTSLANAPRGLSVLQLPLLLASLAIGAAVAA